jgi:hypothetical protein
MARKLRLEFSGACYHVINRGNYKRAIFEANGTAGSFEKVMENEYALESSQIRTIGRGGPEALALLAIRQKQWQGALNAGAKYLKIELSELPRPKSAPVKVALAAAMRSTTSASNQWLAEKLQMGKAASVSQFVRPFRLAENQKTRKFKILLSRV